MKELNLQLERLEQRIAPGLISCVSVPCVTAPSICTTSSSSTSSCPPPDDSCSDTTSGGNNGYGNGGSDGVPGNSANNDAPNSDEKAADQVR